MDEMLLRGFVTPEDFSGTDTEKLQKALDVAAEKDIRKVVLGGSYVIERPLVIPARTHLVLENATIDTAGDFPALTAEKHENYSFEQKWIYIEGGTVAGADFFNASHIVMENMIFTAPCRLDYCHDVRMEDVKFAGGYLQITDGCFGFILQRLTGQKVEMTAGCGCGKIVPGRAPDIHDIILRDSAVEEVLLRATEEAGLFNMQADHIAGAVTVGEAGVSLPRERYFNLTFTHLQSLTLHNEVKHMYTESV